MRSSLAAIIGLCFLLWGCATGGFPSETAAETEKVPFDKVIEISLAHGSFGVEEVEFHVDQQSIPESLLAKAKELVPEGYVADCEIEYHGGETFYEVTFSAKGGEHEVMITPEGEPYRWEIEIDRAQAPEAAVKAAEAAVPGGWLKKCESILDGEKKPIEYHFKLERKGIKYKAVVSLDGNLEQLYRETKGEIEVPLL